MFEGGTRYVETLDAVLEFVTDHQPTTDELAGVASRFVFDVSSRESIMRRVTYLQQAGFVREKMITGCSGTLVGSMFSSTTWGRCLELCVSGMLGFGVCCMRCLLGR